MIEKTCKQCGQPFHVRNDQWDIRKFCSKVCRRLASVTTSNCVVCGKPFETRHTVVKFRKCCSVLCLAVWKTKTITGSNNPKWRGGLTKHICQQCGKEFFDTHYMTARKFCSRDCQHKAQSLKVGEKAARWRGGKSFEPYPPAFNRQFKRMICERDNYTCAVCKQYGKVVHHINYVKDDVNPKNCVTVCPSCHGKTNSNRSYWISYFTPIIMAKYS